MGVVIRTNCPSIFAGHNLKKNSKKSQSALEKLASGNKINRAADNASGLAISEKMRAQITALDAYSYNTENGINLVHTADGAMAEICEMLQRGVELATKAANGIYEDTEREIIQMEIDEINDEIDRTADTTNFNTRILLKGGSNSSGNIAGATIIGTAPKWVRLDPLSKKTETMGSIYDIDGERHCAGYLDFSTFTPNDIKSSVGKGFYTTCCTCKAFYSIKFTASSDNNTIRSGNHFIYEVGLSGVQTAEDIYDRIIEATDSGNPNEHFTQFEKTEYNGQNCLMVYDNRSGVRPVIGSYGLLGYGIAYDSSDNNVKKFYQPTITINSGEGKSGKIYIGLPDVSTRNLGVKYVSVLTQEDSNAAMGEFRAAIDTVNLYRANLGALENRMEYTVDNINITHENISAAKSRIKDADMAEEMMRYTKENILVQTAQAMLAQANTRSQDVLQLLQ